MRVAVPSEVKNHEYRVAITPVGVAELVAHGHEIYVQAGAGAGLHVDLVAVCHQFGNSHWGDRHPVLVVLDLGRDSDPHGGPLCSHRPSLAGRPKSATP